MNERLSHRRYIKERIVIRGDLILETPTCLSSGDSESPTDLPLLRDSVDDRALLTGTSLAGALRNYLWRYQQGYSASEDTATTTLLGNVRSQEDDSGEQSLLIVHDSISRENTVKRENTAKRENTINIELRDGVKIRTDTGIAQDKAKYDLELLAAGTVFPLYLELLIENDSKRQIDRDQLLLDLAIALDGLGTGEIAIGMKKRRGFGQCRVEHWRVEHFDLTDAVSRYAWLTHAHWPLEPNKEHPDSRLPKYPTIEAAMNAIEAIALSTPLANTEDKRTYFNLSVGLDLAGALLIRSATESDQLSPDVVHLTSRRADGAKPVLSGTSLAGVLRHRAIRILNTLGQSISLIDDLFGPDLSENRKVAKASRLLVKESVINHTEQMVQNRIAIDRFTGGALDGALFNEQPIFPNSAENVAHQVELTLRIQQPRKSEIGLLLLLLKDLWTGDLSVGGSASIGRGRLQGKTATLTYQKAGERQTWTIEGKENLTISNAQRLEDFVEELVNLGESDLQDERTAA
ncbi:MAG: RAMP superfamily CRISPR-associated protein [Cyanobacteria bacterium J06634_6]